jgi:hypothetical protein
MSVNRLEKEQREPRRAEIETKSPPLRPSTLLAVGMTLATIYIGALLILMPTTTYDVWGALVIGPILLALTLPTLAHEARAQRSRRLFWLLVVALILKLSASVIQYHVAFDVYGGLADSKYYYDQGVELSEQFRLGDFSTTEPLTGIHFINFLTGLLFSVIGPTKLGGFVFYSWLGFMGLFFFYRAFVTAVPEGRLRSYALPLFFLPSFLFWPSTIGKEAWMLFSLGIAAFGAARVLSRQMVSGLLAAGLGLWLAGLARPHIAGLMGIAIAAGFVFQKPRKDLRQLAPLIKVLAMGAVFLVALLFVARADRFLRDRGLETERGTTQVLWQITGRTFRGGSSFAPSILESPIRAPVAVVTVLFRPLLPEAHNAQAILAAAEGTFLILLTFVRIPWLIAALRSIRRQPYVGFSFAFAALFVVAHSSLANFGILVRHRIQLLPLYLVLLAIPPPGWRRSYEQDKASKSTGMLAAQRASNSRARLSPPEPER